MPKNTNIAQPALASSSTSRFGRLMANPPKPALQQTQRTPVSSPALRDMPDVLSWTPPARQSVRPPSPPHSSAESIRPRGSRFQAKGPWEPTTKFSDEQQEIINCMSKTVVANAFAGTGKTTTAAGYAARRRNANILYMPFGKTVQMEAIKRFPPNTTCQTINSAAYEAASPGLRAKLVNSFTPMLIREELNLGTNRQAGMALAVLSQFMSSAERDFHHSFIQSLCESKWRASESEANDALNAAKMAWRRMTDETKSMPIPHDALLKIWSLKDPVLKYDHILFDEAQDTNAVTFDIIRQQKHATRVFIGDRHQAIYGFRGATNAMEKMSLDTSAVQLHLSQTWRFGPQIAEVANLILGEIKGESTKIIGMGTDSAWKNKAPYTKLSRTNAQLFREAAVRQGKGIHWAGPNGIDGYSIARVTQAYKLFARDECTDQLLRKFGSWAELQSYAEDSRDQEIRMLVNLIDEIQHDTPELIHNLTTGQVHDESQAEVTFTTAHKSKGLDWAQVEICDDFEILEEAEKAIAADYGSGLNSEMDQEVNLLYVAATRAKSALHLNSETKQWIEDLDKHRIDRNLAAQRYEARKNAMRGFMSRV